ncbi:MAG: hypothetical protein ACTHU0_19935 [Kofleriaceae bacterium]
MRDPKCIDRVIAKLRALWHADPDMRLGQLVANLTPASREVSFVEDDVLEERLNTVMHSGWPGLR